MKKSPLIQAIEKNDLLTLEALLQSGADLEQKDSYGCTPLQAAVALGNVEIARILLNAGAELTCLNEHAMGGAIYKRRLDVMSFLIEAGIDVNMKFKENEDRTALMEAVHTGDLNIIKKLVESGADPNALSCKGAYALMNAAGQGFQEVFNYLAPLTSPKLRQWAERELQFSLERKEREKRGRRN